MFKKLRKWKLIAVLAAIAAVILAIFVAKKRKASKSGVAVSRKGKGARITIQK